MFEKIVFLQLKSNQMATKLVSKWLTIKKKRTLLGTVANYHIPAEASNWSGQFEALPRNWEADGGKWKVTSYSLTGEPNGSVTGLAGD